MLFAWSRYHRPRREQIATVPKGMYGGYVAAYVSSGVARGAMNTSEPGRHLGRPIPLLCGVLPDAREPGVWGAPKRVDSSLRDSGRTLRLGSGQAEASAPTLGVVYAEDFGHFLVEKAFAGAVGLDPSAINHELRNGSFARAANDLVCGTGRGFNVDFFERDVVLREEALGGPAVRAPEGGVEHDLH